MKLFIPLIHYNRTCLTPNFLSVLKLVLYLKDNNIPVTLFPIAFESLISRARNAAVAEFMSDPSATHLIFLDGDIEFEVADVMRLLHVNEPVVCAGYPQKWLDEEKMKEVFRGDKVPPAPLEICTKCSVHLVPTDVLADVMEAEYATTGFLCIRREVIETLMKSYPDRKYRNDIDGYGAANPNMFYDLFGVEINKETRRYESEDYVFSRLWRATGGKIWCVTSISLKHHGWYAFQGNVYRQLESFRDNR